MKNFTVLSRSICTVLLLIASLPGWGREVVEKNVQVDSLYYDLYDDGTAEVVRNNSYRNYNNIVIPNEISVGGRYSVTSIESEAFYYCTSLQSIDIPNSVTNIGKYAFSGCTSLKSIQIPNSVTSIAGGAFWDCTSLQSVQIPYSVAYIEWSTFSGCTSLENIQIPYSVIYIEGSAFSGCTSLQSIDIPNSVIGIEQNAFDECTSLQSITCNAEVPPETSTWGDAFSSSTYTDATLYVPATSVEAYKTSEYEWSKFTNIKSIGETTVIFTPEASTLQSPETIYTLDGTRISGEVGNLKRGTYIIKQGGTVRKVVVK